MNSKLIQTHVWASMKLNPNGLSQPARLPRFTSQLPHTRDHKSIAQNQALMMVISILSEARQNPSKLERNIRRTTTQTLVQVTTRQMLLLIKLLIKQPLLLSEKSNIKV